MEKIDQTDAPPPADPRAAPLGSANLIPSERGKKRIIVIGGGLAGMSAAVALQDSGAAVTLLEARQRLGGRAGSFQDPQSGEELDNCQHVLLGCCTNLLDFYRRIGVSNRIRFERTIHFRASGGKRYDLYGVRGLAAPLHLLPAMLHFSALTLKQRRQAAGAMLAMMRLGRAGRKKLAEVPFGRWLDQHKQSPELVRILYDTVLVGALNEQTRAASAEYAIEVFQDSLLSHRAGYVIGIPNCTLSELYRGLPIQDLRLGTRAAGLEFSGDRITAVRLQSGELLPCDALVLASNHHAISRFIPEPWWSRDSRFASLEKLQSVPILGAHLWFDRPVMSDSHAALLEGPLQWIFRKDETGRALHGVISAARDWVDRPRDQMLQIFEQQVRATFREARQAKLDRGVIVIEKRATFSPAPGVDHFRPGQAPPPGGISNLILAGDYTQTGWPATMEGAVRSGLLAAAAALGKEDPHCFLVEDLRSEWPARWMARSVRQRREEAAKAPTREGSAKSYKA
jgi:zeta-carotene desaturase